MKYSIFHLQGGIGNHIAATAVEKTIKTNYPDRKLIVVCAYPDIFMNTSYVDRVLTLGNISYFYQEYIQDKDSILFHHEPYYTTNHIHKKKKLIENWCEMYGLADMHDVRENLAKVSADPREILPETVWESCQGTEFWRGMNDEFNESSSYSSI